MIFFFKQKTAYEMRISDWSSDVCSSDLARQPRGDLAGRRPPAHRLVVGVTVGLCADGDLRRRPQHLGGAGAPVFPARLRRSEPDRFRGGGTRSEEHTSELQSLMRISYAVFCLKKKTTLHTNLQ